MTSASGASSTGDRIDTSCRHQTAEYDAPVATDLQRVADERVADRPDAGGAVELDVGVPQHRLLFGHSRLQVSGGQQHQPDRGDAAASSV